MTTSTRHPSLHLVRHDASILGVRISTEEDPYLGLSTIAVLQAAIEVVTHDPEIRAVVLEGGIKHFSAGASRESLTVAGAGLRITGYVGEIPRLLLDMPVPLVAAMAGHAIGGGFVLGLWCDAVVLAEESLYGANFMALGFTPGMGSTVVMEEALGGYLGRELLYSGRLLKGRELRATGAALAHAVVARDGVDARAMALATEFAAAPREALVLLKRRLSSKRRAQLETAIVEEREMHKALFSKDSTGAAIAERYAVALPSGRGTS